MGGDAEEAEKHGRKLSQHQAYDSGCGRQDTSLFQGNLVNKEDGSYTDNLLNELRGGGNGRFLKTVVIAADAGMAGAEGDGDRHNLQKDGAACFPENVKGNPFRMGVEKKGGKKGKA